MSKQQPVIDPAAYDELKTEVLEVLERYKPKADIATIAATSLDAIQVLAIANGMPAQSTYSISDAAKLTGYSERAIYRAVEKGDLEAKPAVKEDKSGKKINSKHLAEWLENL